MKSAYLKVGQHLTLHNQAYEVVRIVGAGVIQLESQFDFKLLNKTKDELLREFDNGHLKFTATSKQIDPRFRPDVQSKDLSSYSMEQQRIAKLRLDYINLAVERLGAVPTLKGLDRIVSIVAASVKDPKPPGVNSLYGWWRRWEASSCDITALVPKVRRTGYMTTAFSKPVKKMLGDIIHDDYLKAEAYTVQDAYDQLKYRVNQFNKTTTRTLKMPSRSSVFRYFRRLDRYDVLLAKKGKRYAKQAFRATGRGIFPDFILSRVEIDHSPTDLIVIDEKTHLAIGRPNLTCLVDKYSRAILGFALSFEPPSELSVIRALRHALFPKITLKDNQPDIVNDWLAYGVPMTLVVDNGLEFHSQMLRQLCYELNIELVFCPKKEPQFKGCVERTLGTLNRQVSHRCAGTTFSNINERADYDSMDSARVTLAEANDLITQWIVDVYHQSRHSITGYTPDYLWNEGLATVEPRLPESRDAFDLASARPYKDRRLAHDGIRFLYLNYNSSDMQTIRRNPSFEGRVNIRVNHEDLGFIWVHDQANDEYIKVPCTHMEYAGGLSLLQHQKILEEKKLDSDTHYDEDKYLEGKEKLRQKINELNSDRLLRERKRGARIAMKAATQSVEKAFESDDPIRCVETKFSDLGDIPQFETQHIGVR